MDANRKKILKAIDLCAWKWQILTPSDRAFQLIAFIFSPIPQSPVAVIIRSKTPKKKNSGGSLFSVLQNVEGMEIIYKVTAPFHFCFKIDFKL